MKHAILYLTLPLAILFFACDKDSADPAPQEGITVTLSDGETHTFSEIEMHFDTLQQATFVKFTDDENKVRVNFKGREPGTYTDDRGIFYWHTYDAAGNPSGGLVCDTYTGILVEVDTYGDIGEVISGTFSADDCDGNFNSPGVTGTFSVVRTE